MFGWVHLQLRLVVSYRSARAHTCTEPKMCCYSSCSHSLFYVLIVLNCLASINSSWGGANHTNFYPLFLITSIQIFSFHIILGICISFRPHQYQRQQQQQPLWVDETTFAAMARAYDRRKKYSWSVLDQHGKD